ncbi:serine/threonine protein kinase [Ktedonobacteria bacterium brp13]|nr:serine/threonine protein kinase [Ktedonobacteria bacterium brp13]
MVTDSNELLGQALGTCTLQSLLGRGGMGAVYLARQSRPRRTVAVKVLLPSLVLELRPRNEFLARFRREADAIAALDHINIMPIYEYGEQGDIAYLVMPYVTGGTLRELLEEHNILPLDEVVTIIEQAAAALDTAHAQSIVHRDLKPGNILFHADGRILLADFGLAKVLKDVTDQESSNGHLTSIGTIIGTPEYLSPEQGTGDAIDYRTDVYSLGVVLYQMLAGRVPFTGTSPVAVAIKHALEQPPLPTQFNPSVPKKVEAVVMKAMSKKPYQRYDSAGEFALALRQAVIEEMGEQFLRVEPTPRIDHHATPAPPPLDDKQTTMATPETSATQKSDDEEKATEQARTLQNDNAKEDERLPSMSTMLMEPGQEKAIDSAPVKEPRLSEHTKNRIPALPTVITDAGASDMTIADYPRTTQPPGPQQQVQQPVVLRQETPLAPLPIRHPQRPTQPAKSKLVPVVSVCLALLVVIIGAIAVYTHSNSQSAKTGGTSAATTKTAVSKTPTAQQTQQATLGSGNSNQSGKAYPLPTPMASVGNLLYDTNYPANCDGKGNNWTTQGVQVTCKNDSVQLTNTSSNTRAGTFIKTPINGNYYVQLQAMSNTSGTFNLYVYNETGSAYKFVVDMNAGTWTSYYVTQSSSQQLTKPPVSLQLHAPTTTLTFGVMVEGPDFVVYANGQTVGTSNTQYGGTSNGDTAGVGVDPGSSISIKNFAVYSE